MIDLRTMRTPLVSRILVAALAAAAPASASDLSLSVQVSGQNSVSALPGEVLVYSVVAELSDNANEGLALFCFDLAFDGGDLVPAQLPLAGPLLEFSFPRGVTNPAGFGGTPVGGDLLQVGGAQNTIKNVFAPQPTGNVVTGVAANGAPIVLVQGTLTAPTQPGSYTLSAHNLVANVIRQGQTGSGSHWIVEAAGAGAITNLALDVVDCTPSVYCTAKVNSQGCTPSIGFVGAASLSDPAGLLVTCDDVLNRQFGQWFYGLTPSNMPFAGGIRCVAQPFARAPVVPTLGDPFPTQNCSGSLSFSVTPAFLSGQGFLPGQQVHGQWWYRDPQHLDGTGIGLSNAIQFIVCP